MRPSIVLFGDSITEEAFGEGGWGASLANHYSRSADVVLRGYSGYNTRWAARVAGPAVASIAGPVSAVTVFFGANDAALPDRASAPQHVPLAEYKDNLRAICALLKKRWPSVVVILITPPPVDEDGRLRYPYAHDFSGLPERTNAAAAAYARACLEVARQCGLRAINIWSRMQRFPGWEKSFLRDGLHLTPRGNRVLFEEVVFALKDANLSLSLEALPADLPLFGDMDRERKVLLAGWLVVAELTDWERKTLLAGWLAGQPAEQADQQDDEGDDRRPAIDPDEGAYAPLVSFKKKRR